MLLCGARQAEAGMPGGSQPSLRRWMKNAAWPPLTAGQMCLRHLSRGRRTLPGPRSRSRICEGARRPSTTTGGARPGGHRSPTGRFGHHRHGVGRCRTGRAERGRRARCRRGFRLFMFLVPYAFAFVMVTGFRLASTAAGQNPGDAARSAGIGGLLASAVTSNQHLVTDRPVHRAGPGRFRPGLDGPAVRPSPLDRPPPDLEGPTAAQAQPWAPLILIGLVTALFGVGDSDVVDRLAVAPTAVGRFPYDDRHFGRAWSGGCCRGINARCGPSSPKRSSSGWEWECCRSSPSPRCARGHEEIGALRAIGIALALLLWTYLAGRLLKAAIAANATLWKHRTGQVTGQASDLLSPPRGSGAHDGAGEV